jgi:ADP-ribose pyrophosphatase YjhB (NUDIX family)
MSSHHHDDAPRFCSRCGGTLVPSLLKPGEPERPVCQTCGHVVYLDPKVAVGTIISNDSRQVAMVRRAIEPGYGKWVFPGGYVDRGEELLAAAAREAWEEARLRVRIEGLVNIYSYRGRVPVIIVYAATSVGGELRAEDESLEAEWFSESNLPWSELAFPSTRQGLRDYFQGIIHPHVSQPPD